MTEFGTRILVVDDSIEYLGFMETLLTGEGFVVTLAASVGAVRDHLRDSRPDVIISDVRMPDLPAFGVLDLLKADPRTRDLPVLFCTGAEQEVEAAGERLQRPDTDVLLKPFDIDELLARIARLVKR